MGDRSTKILLLIMLVAAFRSPFPFFGDSVSKTPDSTPDSTPQSFHTTSAVLPSDDDRRATLRLAPGTSVLVGSLDQSAHRHQLRLSWRPDHAQDAIDLQAAPLLTGSHQVLTFPNSWDAPLAAQLPEGDHESHAVMLPEVLTDRVALPLATLPNPRRRRFVVPCFYAHRVHDRHVLASEIARGRRVSVFLVDGDETAFRPQDAAAAGRAAFAVASQVIQQTEGRVLDFVESRIGPITDLDEDGRLSFVLARLSTDDLTETNQQPITGCVRPDDFLSGLRSENCADTGGDIAALACLSDQPGCRTTTSGSCSLR